MEIVHRFKIDDVQHVTSNETHRSHIASLRFHERVSSYCRASGITNIATQRSEMANETCLTKKKKK